MAFPPARNPRSGKQYKHRTRNKRKKIKIISLTLYPFILKSKVFHCYENGSTKNLIHHSDCTRCIFVQKVKWNGMAVSFYVTLDPTRSPSWSAPSPPRWSRRQGWALPLSAPSSFQWSGWLPPALWLCHHNAMLIEDSEKLGTFSVHQELWRRLGKPLFEMCCFP